MSDLISRQAAIDALLNHYEVGNTTQNATMDDCVMIIRNLPSAQPEIVRCKNCEYSEHWYGDKCRCFLWVDDGISVFDDGFCNYGKARENND